MLATAPCLPTGWQAAGRLSPATAAPGGSQFLEELVLSLVIDVLKVEEESAPPWTS